LTSSNKRYYSESWKDNKTEITENRENNKYKIIITLNKNNYKINEMKNCHCKSEYCFGDWETYSKNKNWTQNNLGKNKYAREKSAWNKKHLK
jgi:hypothetical protein